MKWISVDDRLPKEAKLKQKPPNLEWLIWDGVIVDITALHPSHWNVQYEYSDITECQVVTHWMPLPEPPKN